MMDPDSKLVQPTAKEEEKVPEILKVEMTLDKQIINCYGFQTVTLKINVTNKGTVAVPALSILHQYKNYLDEEV